MLRLALALLVTLALCSESEAASKKKKEAAPPDPPKQEEPETRPQVQPAASVYYYEARFSVTPERIDVYDLAFESAPLARHVRQPDVEVASDGAWPPLDDEPWWHLHSLLTGAGLGFLAGAGCWAAAATAGRRRRPSRGRSGAF